MALPVDGVTSRVTFTSVSGDSASVKPEEVVGEDFIQSFKKFNTHVQGSTFALETRRQDFPKFKGSKNPVSERNIETYLNRYENKRNENAVDTDGQNAFYKLRAKRNRTDLDVYSSDPPLKTPAYSVMLVDGES